MSLEQAQLKNSDLTAAYVVTEERCVVPGSGAHEHIRIGQQELSKHFCVHTLLPANNTTSQSLATIVSQPRLFDPSPWKGALRDLRQLFIRFRGALALQKQITKVAPDFVYFRANFLDSLPLILRLRGIPCIIEANGLQFDNQTQYYKSFLTPLNRQIERIIYRAASHVFFVGSYGDYWRLGGGHWSNVENGVEEEFLNMFPTPRVATSGPLRLCFVGSLMQHHRPDVLVDAVRMFASDHDVEIHLVGSNLGGVARELHQHLQTIEHGFLNRSALAELLGGMDVGLIPGVTDFQSQMKLFDYGAARMAVVAPHIHNLNVWFPNDLIFFEPNNSSAMARALTALASDREKVARMGNKLHQRIQAEFTWDKIFANKAAKITSIVNASP